MHRCLQRKRKRRSAKVVKRTMSDRNTAASLCDIRPRRLKPLTAPPHPHRCTPPRLCPPSAWTCPPTRRWPLGPFDWTWHGIWIWGGVFCDKTPWQFIDLAPTPLPHVLCCVLVEPLSAVLSHLSLMLQLCMTYGRKRGGGGINMWPTSIYLDFANSALWHTNKWKKCRLQYRFCSFFSPSKNLGKDDAVFERLVIYIKNMPYFFPSVITKQTIMLNQNPRSPENQRRVCWACRAEKPPLACLFTVQPRGKHPWSNFPDKICDLFEELFGHLIFNINIF